MGDPTKEAAQSASAPLTDLNKMQQLVYGDDSDIRIGGLNKNLEDQIKAAEDRYAQPNWWKVAAGFAKPQLGGFMASLGSASEALGENLEQQRAMGIPLAKMRTELAVNQALLGRNKEVSDEINAWYKDPANAGKLPPDQLAADWRARAPDSPAVKSMDTQVGLQQKAREQAAKNIEIAQKLGQEPNPVDLQVLGHGANPKTPEPNKKEESVSADIPLNPADVKPGQKVDFGFAKIPSNQLLTPQGQAKIAAEEDVATKKLETIAEFGSPENYHKNTQNINQLLDYAGKGARERALLQSVTNKMASDSSLVSAISAATNEGLHLSWNGYQASAGAPIKTFLNNLQDKEERRVAQMLVMALDNANYVQTQMRGGLKGGLPVSEANVLTAGLFSRDLDYKVLMNGMLQLENNMNMYRDIYEGSRTLRSKYGDQLTTYAPNYQIYKSDWYNKAVGHYVDRSKNISSKYNSTLSNP